MKDDHKYDNAIPKIPSNSKIINDFNGIIKNPW